VVNVGITNCGYRGSHELWLMWESRIVGTVGITNCGRRIRHADHVAPSIPPKKLAPTSLTSGGRSAGIARSRTKAREFAGILLSELSLERGGSLKIFHHNLFRVQEQRKKKDSRFARLCSGVWSQSTKRSLAYLWALGQWKTF
jgi:hypothetical protein